MGYVPEQPEDTAYRLVFEGRRAGLEVVARSASIGEYLDIAELANHEFSSPPTRADVAIMAKLFKAFARVLVSWNVERPDGTEVPATYGGVRAQGLPFVLDLTRAWLDGVAGVAPPLPEPSNDGDSSVAGSIPMEALSSSPAS
jgi:hypothetical protein